MYILIYQDPKDQNLLVITVVSRNVYIDKLDDIVDKYNNTYYRAIKMKLVDFKPDTYIDYGVA